MYCIDAKFSVSHKEFGPLFLLVLSSYFVLKLFFYFFIFPSGFGIEKLMLSHTTPYNYLSLSNICLYI